MSNFLEKMGKENINDFVFNIMLVLSVHEDGKLKFKFALIFTHNDIRLGMRE